jgi:hypothetical protein
MWWLTVPVLIRFTIHLWLPVQCSCLVVPCLTWPSLNLSKVFERQSPSESSTLPASHSAGNTSAWSILTTIKNNSLSAKLVSLFIYLYPSLASNKNENYTYQNWLGRDSNNSQRLQPETPTILNACSQRLQPFSTPTARDSNHSRRLQPETPTILDASSQRLQPFLTPPVRDSNHSQRLQA